MTKANTEVLEEAVKVIKDRFGAAEHRFRDEVTLIIPPQNIIEAAQTLRDTFGFNVLIDETAVDYWPQTTPRFHVVYHLYSMPHNLILRLRVPLNGNAPHVDTMEKVFPNANWKEREIWDMFGIVFDGHSDLRRILMPADWQGHPLRKDYPLGYEEVQFSFNAEEIDRRKPYAKS